MARASLSFALYCILALLFSLPVRGEENRWWPESVQKALAQAGPNEAELLSALREAPTGQRAGLVFLLENMPLHDLEALSAEFLLRNLDLSYKALETAPWSASIPTELFLNDILPYASINEKRDDWRGTLREICLPLVADCKTPAEAAQRLNERLFGTVQVKYSTRRRKADQSPLESIESGLASCTGLSVLLVDACRSVAVPARIAGIPNWVDKRGNHTWVEVWDGRWHFTGAAEPSNQGLNHTWFQRDASLAIKDSQEHAIYASSFKKTDLTFPMVWAPNATYVSAVNVTDHYTPDTPKPAPPASVRLLVRVLDKPNGDRIAAQVELTSPSNPGFNVRGLSKDEGFDRNDILAFEVPRDDTYHITAQRHATTRQRVYKPSTESQDIVEIVLQDTAKPAVTSATRASCYAPSFWLEPLPAPQDTALVDALQKYFEASGEARQNWQFNPAWDALLARNEPGVRRAAWEAFRAAAVHNTLKQDFDSHQARFEQHVSPYTVKKVGQRPATGWPLFIAMHGGGGAPQEVNDSQWKIMQSYYRDQPESNYLYLALRAPNNTWNGFYTDYVYPLVHNLIRQFLLFGDVDPNKVFIMGYSHGGYGAFAIGPKMPDHFAAIHSSAAAPTDGETTARTLRNTVFTFMIGEKDSAYGRIDRCRRFNEEILKLRGDRTDIYPVTMQYQEGYGHGGLPDRDKIAEMYPHARQPVPRELTWTLTDGVIRDFFWLHTPEPGKGKSIEAQCADNTVAVTTTNIGSFTILLDSRLVDFQRPIHCDVNGVPSTHTIQPSLQTLCQTLIERGDPERAFTAQLTFSP